MMTGLEHLQKLFGSPPRKAAPSTAAFILACGRVARNEATDADLRILDAARPEPPPAPEKVMDPAEIARFVIRCGQRRRGEIP